MKHGRTEADFSLPQARPFLFQGDDHGVLLVHGFTGSVAHMRLIGEHLHEKGFTVKGINLPGHATRLEDMRTCTGQDWLEATKAGIVELKQQCRHVSIAGLSMGGVLSLLVAEQMEVTSVVTISAPMGVQNRLMPYARVAAPFVREIRWSADSERAAQLDAQYDLGYMGFPTRAAAELNDLIKEARRNLYAVCCPILVVQSHGDETIAPASADIIMQGVSSQQKKTLWLDAVPHVCTISRDHQRIADAMEKTLRHAEQA